MLQRTLHDNGVVTYQSPLLAVIGVPHAFSTRIGGISPPPFDSLNLGNPTGCDQQDPEPHLFENYDRLQSAIGASHMHRAWVHQVHGRSVELIDHEPENEYAETLAAELRDRFHGQTHADALVTTTPNILLTIRIADCVPILFSNADGTIVAAAHAGWRGIIGNIAAKTLRAMNEAGAATPSITAAIGPAISLAHFEVGPEVAAEFIAHDLLQAVSHNFSEKPHVDLAAAVETQLTRAGIMHIDAHPPCTFANPADFFSHRRDHGTTGRLAAVIARK